MKKNTVRLTESQLHRVIKESVNRLLNEISPSLKQKYIDGRVAQANGERELSPAMLRKSEEELRRYKGEGYPCGGAKTGLEFGRISADDKAYQTYQNGRGKLKYRT